MKTYLYKGDIPKEIILGESIAIDTETMGLNPHRDRLCVVQISTGNGEAHIVQLNLDNKYDCPNLKEILINPNIQKIFHYARFDIAVLYKYLGILTVSIYCTKIASKLTRNFTQRHGLKNLCHEILKVEISKQNQSSDWGNAELTQDQIKYAAGDVLYLHKLKQYLDKLLHRENRTKIAEECFKFLPTIAQLDLLGYEDFSIFTHS